MAQYGVSAAANRRVILPPSGRQMTSVDGRHLVRKGGQACHNRPTFLIYTYK